MKNNFQYLHGIFIILLCCCYCCFCISLVSQNGAKKSWGTARLEYCNPKYTTNCSVVTFKTGDKFLTNMSFTFLVPIGNNVTVGATVECSGDKVKLDYKFCVLLRQPWLLSFLQRQETKLPYPCPYPARSLFMSNLNLPPTNVPLPLKRGRYKLTIDMFRAANQDRMMTFIIEGVIIKNKKKNHFKKSLFEPNILNVNQNNSILW